MNLWILISNLSIPHVEDQFYYFVNGLRAEIKREVLMRQPKDYLTAVNLARRTEFVDHTIADSRSNLNN